MRLFSGFSLVGGLANGDLVTGWNAYYPPPRLAGNRRALSMTDFDEPGLRGQNGDGIGGATRLLSGVAALLLFGLLVTAGCLRPDNRGEGTHEQLGLPPCVWKLLAGVPCPSCGMTTSWSHLVRGQVSASLRANPGGTLAAVMAVILGIGLAESARRGSWSRILLAANAWIAAVLVLGAVVLTFWAWRITVLL